MRLLVDENLPTGAADILRRRGYDAIHIRERGRAGAMDPEILSIAPLEDRWIVTLDSDFSRMIALEKRHKPSVLYLRVQNVDAEITADLIDRLCQMHREDLESGCLLAFTENKIRIRRLPVS